MREAPDYLAAWWRELRSGKGGQRADRPSTWRLDNLWRAAAHEASARELEAAGLHAAAARLRESADEAFLAPSATEAAA